MNRLSAAENGVLNRCLRAIFAWQALAGQAKTSGATIARSIASGVFSMRKWSLKRTCLVLSVVAFIGLWQLPAPPALVAEEAAPERPKLAVLLVFDQMRGDYVQKWRPLFGEGGFKRLQDEGA